MAYLIGYIIHHTYPLPPSVKDFLPSACLSQLLLFHPVLFPNHSKDVLPTTIFLYEIWISRITKYISFKAHLIPLNSHSLQNKLTPHPLSTHTSLVNNADSSCSLLINPDSSLSIRDLPQCCPLPCW